MAAACGTLGLCTHCVVPSVPLQMPPKKKEEPAQKPLLGRFRTNLKVRPPPAVAAAGCRQPAS